MGCNLGSGSRDGNDAAPPSSTTGTPPDHSLTSTALSGLRRRTAAQSHSCSDRGIADATCSTRRRGLGSDAREADSPDLPNPFLDRPQGLSFR